MNQIATTDDTTVQVIADREFGSRAQAFAAEGLIEPGTERKLWSIEKGTYDPIVKGAFIGTQTEVDALIDDLNTRDRANIHFDDDAYLAQEITAVRTADDILGGR